MINLQLKISNIYINFECGNKQEIYNYLLREFEVFLIDKVINSHINIKIINQKLLIKNDYKFIKNNMYVNGKYLLQEIKSKGNKIQVLYNIEEELGKEIVIYIPYKIRKSILEKVIHPSFITKWQCSLINFIHGPFIGIMQIYLLKYKETFLHASAISKSNNGILFVGDGQSGKSMFAKFLSENNNYVIAEDFCIISTENKVISYPKQCRVYPNQLSKTSYFKEMKLYEKLIEKLNRVLFLPFKLINIKVIRRLQFKEIFYNSKIKNTEEISIILFLLREGEVCKINNDEEGKFVSRCLSTMKNEFQNLAGFMQLLEAYEVVKGEKDLFKRLLKDTEKCLKKLYENRECKIMYLPFYENISDAKYNIIEVLKNY